MGDTHFICKFGDTRWRERAVVQYHSEVELGSVSTGVRRRQTVATRALSSPVAVRYMYHKTMVQILITHEVAPNTIYDN